MNNQQENMHNTEYLSHYKK